MLRIIRLAFQSLIARLSGWHLCGVAANDRQSRLLKRLSDEDGGQSLTIPDCFIEDGCDKSANQFFPLGGISRIAELLREHPERLFWLKPAPKYLIVKHALSGEEVWIDAGDYTRASVTEEELPSG